MTRRSSLESDTSFQRTDLQETVGRPSGPAEFVFDESFCKSQNCNLTEVEKSPPSIFHYSRDLRGFGWPAFGLMTENHFMNAKEQFIYLYKRMNDSIGYLNERFTGE